MTRTRTDNYITTLDPMSSSDMRELAVIRKTVSVGNKLKMRNYMYACRTADHFGHDQPVPPVLHQVTVRGRLGKNNPMAAKYRGRRNHMVALADAQRFDVYIHERRR